MSSTNAALERVEHDFYATQEWCVHRLVEALHTDLASYQTWFEPCAGDGAIVRAVSRVRTDVRWHVQELQDRFMPALFRSGNIVEAHFGDLRERLVLPVADVYITNPPFDISLELIEFMLEHGTFKELLILQRLNWAAGPRRYLFRKLKPSVYVLPDRPSFVDVINKKTGKIESGTDSIEYAWFRFDGLGEFHILGDTPDHVRSAEIAAQRANGTRIVKKRKEKKLLDAA